MPGDYCEGVYPIPFRTQSQALLRRWYFVLRHGRVDIARLNIMKIKVHSNFKKRSRHKMVKEEGEFTRK